MKNQAKEPELALKENCGSRGIALSKEQMDQLSDFIQIHFGHEYSPEGWSDRVAEDVIWFINGLIESES